MDGTLINSGTAIANAINYVRGHLKLSPLEKHSMLQAMNDPHISSPEYFYNVPEFTPYHSELFHEYYDKNCLYEMELYTGIKELLEYFYSQKISMSIATNASSFYAQKMFEHLNIKHYFKTIVGADMVENPKPSADMILYTLQNLTIDSSNTILVGDSLKDQMAANNANINSILVNWGFSEHHKAIDTIKDLKNEILRIL